VATPAACLVAAQARQLPQRQTCRHVVDVASLGWLLTNSALAGMIGRIVVPALRHEWSQARWILVPAGVAPMASMVVICLPAAAATGVIQERVGCPSM
jgi:hypothetical protein